MCSKLRLHIKARGLVIVIAGEAISPPKTIELMPGQDIFRFWTSTSFRQLGLQERHRSDSEYPPVLCRHAFIVAIIAPEHNCELFRNS